MHIPVMINEIIKYLDIKKNGIYIDGTFGNGKHSIEILSKLNNNGKLISIDKDIESNLFAKKIIDNRFIFINDNFLFMKNYILHFNLLGKVNGILLDLGISSTQINNFHRGFSFMKNGPLDMRIDNSKGLSASEWINTESERNISNILYKFGEEKNSKKIARNIILKRKNKKITQTLELRNIILSSLKKNDKKIKSLARCFQAIRIYINDELNELTKTLEFIPDILCINGILTIITFHSLEDRIVKNFFKIPKKNSFFLSKIPFSYLEEINIKNKYMNMFFLKKIKPSLEEIKNNPSSRSAILRIFKKIRN